MRSARDLYQSARHIIGYRGDSLIFFGTLDLVYAWSLYSASRSPQPLTVLNAWMATILPLPAWAMAWAVVGLVCLYHAFRHYDRFGFVAAISVKMLWGLLALWGTLMADVSPGAPAIWLGLAGLVWRISGWPEPEIQDEDGDYGP